MGIGGAPEGVLSAVALKCLGGEIQGKLMPSSDEEVTRCSSMGIDDLEKCITWTISAVAMMRSLPQQG